MTAAHVLPDAILARITETPDGCWIFDGSDNGRGYKTISHDYAHRHMYRHFVAPIPDGFDIDHLCRIKACVNPDHLEAVTPAENMRRRFAAQTECKRGHPLPPFIVGQSRKCRLCGVERLAPHGTKSSYNDQGCRCVECRAANTAYMRAWRARKQAA